MMSYDITIERNTITFNVWGQTYQNVDNVQTHTIFENNCYGIINTSASLNNFSGIHHRQMNLQKWIHKKAKIQWWLSVRMQYLWCWCILQSCIKPSTSTSLLNLISIRVCQHLHTAPLPAPARHMASFPDCDQLVYDVIVPGFEGDDSRQSSHPHPSHYWTDTIKNSHW